jgi:hypothetical protein
MDSSEVDFTDAWTPQSCTLPTAERPVRVTEFDQFFSDAVRGVRRRAPTWLSLDLEPAAESAARAADLALRETTCCSFFTFTLTVAGGALQMGVSVPDNYVEVLDALAARAAALAEAQP